MTSPKRRQAGSNGRTICHLNFLETPLTDGRLIDELERLRRYCFAESAGADRTKNHYEKGLRKLRMIIRRIPPEEIESQNPRELVHCSIKLLIHFQNVLYHRESLCNWNERRQYRMARNSYLDLLSLFMRKNESEVVRAVISVMNEENLFEYPDLSLDLITAPVSLGISGSTVVNELWNEVEEPTTPVEIARSIVCTLYEFMDTYDWPETVSTVVALERLLGIYRASIGEGANTSPYKQFKKGLKVCVQRTLEHLSNDHILVVIRHMCFWSVDQTVSDEDVLDFGSSLEYAAYKHATKLFEDTLTPDVFSLLTRMIASSSRLVSLLGNRVMQYLIDRGGNRTRLETPQIFFEDTEYELNVSPYHREDKIFLKNNRAELHECLIRGILNHCSARLNLEMSYCTICLVAIEVPCGFTAAALVCLAMNLQDLTTERDDLRREVTFHVHACVVAILSLLCWIHGAKVFYQYVNKIVMERARWAPHLNPPIQSHYSFATHHVLWDKPELFFVDWEARYGLWKCFRLLES